MSMHGERQLRLDRGQAKEKKVALVYRSIYSGDFLRVIWCWTTRVDGSRNDDDNADDDDDDDERSVANTIMRRTKKREEGQLSRFFHQVHFHCFCCALMISGLYCIRINGTMRNNYRSRNSKFFFFSLSLSLCLPILALYDYSSIHFQCNVNDGEWVGQRARWRVVRVCVRMLFLSLCRFSTQNKGKNETTFLFFPHFSLGFPFFLFVTTTHYS
jgi:hypothetical protein